MRAVFLTMAVMMGWINVFTALPATFAKEIANASLLVWCFVNRLSQY